MTEQRQRIVEEIYATEKSYVESMGYCIDYFYKTLTSDKNPTKITKEDVQNLFQHYDQILNINKGFKIAMDELRQKNILGDQIGKIFTQYIPFFKVYIPFISHFDNVNNIISKYEKEEGFYDSMVKIMETIPTNNPQDLRSYLIMPVQRLPRYELLLRDLLKNTEESHADYVNLQTAYDKIKETTMFVNEKSKEFEQRNKVLQVNDLITGLHDLELIQPDRSLILEGELIKVCKKANKPRYFYLFNDIIIYGIGVQKITVSEYFFLKSVRLENDTRYENSFAIINDIKSFSVICKDAKEKEKWFTEITKHVEIQKKLSSTKEENSRPVWVPDKDAVNCLVCGKQFTAINRRHHCRKCGRCICGDCSRGKMILKEGGEPERVCIYCLDLTKLTTQQQRQTIKRMQSCDRSDIFNSLNFNSSSIQTGKKSSRQRKKSNAELTERKTFAELMNGLTDETKKGSQSMMFDFVHDKDINLKSSIGNQEQQPNQNSLPLETIASETKKHQTLGDIQASQSTVNQPQQKELDEMNINKIKRKSSSTTNLNMNIMIDNNDKQNVGKSESNQKTPIQKTTSSERKTQKLEKSDLLELENESSHSNESNQSQQRIGKQHSLLQPNGNKQQKEMDHEKKKELMFEGLETLSREYHNAKTPRASSKNATPSFEQKQRSQSVQIVSQSNPTSSPSPASQPSDNPLNSSFDKPFDFDKSNEFTQASSQSKRPKTTTKTKSRSKSTLIVPNQSEESKRKSIPESFDFTTETNLFSTPNTQSSSTSVNMMPPNQIKTKRVSKRSNSSVNSSSSQSPQIPMFDFTTNNDFNQQPQQSLNTRTDLFDFTQPQQIQQQPKQQTKMTITIDNSSQQTMKKQQQPNLFDQLTQPRQNYQMNSMNIQIENASEQQQEQPKQTTHKRRRSMSRESKRKRSQSKEHEEQSENMKKLTEMYNENQKEQQIQLQNAQVFNLSNSFFSSMTSSSSSSSSQQSNNLNSSFSSNSSIPENKMTLSKKDRHTLIFNNSLETPKETINPPPSNSGKKESRVLRNRRLFEQKIQKQKDDEKRDFMLRSSVMSSDFK